jgi:hypothetical protein
MNVRRDRGPELFPPPQNQGGMPRPHRNIEQIMAGGSREEIDMHMGLFLHRYGRQPEGDPIKK